jgi:hypothetical protein
MVTGEQGCGIERLQRDGRSWGYRRDCANDTHVNYSSETISLKYYGQRDRDARARGRFQRVVNHERDMEGSVSFSGDLRHRHFRPLPLDENVLVKHQQPSDYSCIPMAVGVP